MLKLRKNARKPQVKDLGFLLIFGELIVKIKIDSNILHYKHFYPNLIIAPKQPPCQIVIKW